MLAKATSFILILLSFQIGFMSSQAKAWDLRTSQEQDENSLAISGEMSQFALSGGSISGEGVRLDFNHSFQQNFSAEVFLSTALNTTAASSFTGFGGYALYNLFGTGLAKQQATSLDGVPLIRESEEQASIVQVGLGLNQYLLNGSKGVYSSSGVGVVGNYIFKAFKYNLKASAKYSALVSDNTAVQGLFLSLGIVFPL